MLDRDPRRMIQDELLAWVQGLIDRDVVEGHSLDYKSDFGAPRELVKDLIAFANERGGTILVGVPENPDNPHHPTKGQRGIPRDEASVERLRSTAADAILPRLPDWEVTEVGLSNGKVVYLIWIPRSWAGPHQRNDGRFYYRAGDRSLVMPEYMVRERYREAFERGARITSWLESEDISYWDGVLLHNFRAALLPTFEWLAQTAITEADLPRATTVLPRALAHQRLEHTWFGFHSVRVDDTDPYLRVYSTGQMVLWSILSTPLPSRETRIQFPIDGILSNVAGLVSSANRTRELLSVADEPGMLDVRWRLRGNDQTAHWRRGRLLDETTKATLEAGRRLHVRIEYAHGELEEPRRILKELAARLFRYVGIPDGDQRVEERDCRLFLKMMGGPVQLWPAL